MVVILKIVIMVTIVMKVMVVMIVLIVMVVLIVMIVIIVMVIMLVSKVMMIMLFYGLNMPMIVILVLFDTNTNVSRYEQFMFTPPQKLNVWLFYKP